MKWQLSIFFCFLSYLTVNAQTVKNVRDSFDQSRQLMLLHYDLKGLDYRLKMQVIPSIKLNDTLLSIKNISGDFGWINRNGKNKLIIWDPLKDGITNLKDIQIGLKTELRFAEIPSFKGVEAQISSNGSLGVKFMQLGKFGFFVSLRKGRSAPDYRYMISNAGEINYLESGVYKVTDKRLLASSIATGGGVLQIARKVYGYAGLGYGQEFIFWGYQAYNLDKNPIGDFWALNSTISRKGVAVDAGAVIKLGAILIDIGVSSVQFSSFQIIGGIGFTFYKNKNKIDKNSRVPIIKKSPIRF